MSLSNPSLQNPANRFYQWSGSRGQLEWYDKEKSQNITVPLPFKFIVLDELHTITGYSDTDQSGYWANEVRSTRDDFTVRTKRGVKYVGSYKNDQGIVQVPQGAKYAKSIYIAHKVNNEWRIGNIKLSGAGLTAWIDMNGKHKTEGNVTAITGSTDGKKGATEFKIPTFEYGGAPQDDALQVAIELDRQLQGYLNQYLAAPKFNDQAEPVTSFDDKATPEQVADFERRKAEKFADKQEDEEIKSLVAPPDNNFDDEPINLSDIPF